MGKQILKFRQKDFDLLYLLKEDNYHILTSQLDHNKHIRREQITKDINKIRTIYLVKLYVVSLKCYHCQCRKLVKKDWLNKCNKGKVSSQKH